MSNVQGMGDFGIRRPDSMTPEQQQVDDEEMFGIPLADYTTVTKEYRKNSSSEQLPFVRDPSEKTTVLTTVRKVALIASGVVTIGVLSPVIFGGLLVTSAVALTVLPFALVGAGIFMLHSAFQSLTGGNTGEWDLETELQDMSWQDREMEKLDDLVLREEDESDPDIVEEFLFQEEPKGSSASQTNNIGNVYEAFTISRVDNAIYSFKQGFIYPANELDYMLKNFLERINTTSVLGDNQKKAGHEIVGNYENLSGKEKIIHLEKLRNWYKDQIHLHAAIEFTTQLKDACPNLSEEDKALHDQCIQGLKEASALGAPEKEVIQLLMQNYRTNIGNEKYKLKVREFQRKFPQKSPDWDPREFGEKIFGGSKK